MFITNVLYRWMYNAADANNSLCVSVVVKKVSNSSKNLPLQVAHVAFAFACSRSLAIALACGSLLSSEERRERKRIKKRFQALSTTNRKTNKIMTTRRTSHSQQQPTTANEHHNIQGLLLINLTKFKITSTLPVACHLL